MYVHYFAEDVILAESNTVFSTNLSEDDVVLDDLANLEPMNLDFATSHGHCRVKQSPDTRSHSSLLPRVKGAAAASSKRTIHSSTLYSNSSNKSRLYEASPEIVELE